MRLTNLILVGTCVVALGGVSLGRSGVFAQTFRSSVDVIVVDVQVRDRTGRATSTLGADDFEVTLDGRRRQVVSATFTQYAVNAALADTLNASRGATSTLADGTLPARTFIVAIDTASFRDVDIRVATLAAERFTRQLGPNDRVGLVVLPDGAGLAPSTSHASVRQALAFVVGRKSASTHFEMGVEEVIDITAAMANQSTVASRQTVGRIISTSQDDFSDAGDSLACAGMLNACTEQAMTEALGLAMSLEKDVGQSISGLDRLLRELQATPERKSVLLLSGGMPVSDRSGGRPSIADGVRRLGERAAYANATINTIYFDPSVNGVFTAGSQRRGGGSGRARVIDTRALAEFSEPSGGTLLVATTGAGESEIDRILTQTSSYYLVGVTPSDRDRDGRPHRLRVSVRQRGTEVHHRQLVVVPKGP